MQTNVFMSKVEKMNKKKRFDDEWGYEVDPNKKKNKNKNKQREQRRNTKRNWEEEN